MTDIPLTIIGAGLAGSEAAWQAAQRGVPVRLLEMRPARSTGAHQSDQCAELVCSNSLGSALADRPSGLLKDESRRMGSLLVRVAEETAVPAGGALAVDRDQFAATVTRCLEAHPAIDLVRTEADEIPAGPALIASGPLTSPALSESLARMTGNDHLYFFDAISPIVEADSIDMSRAYRASRYDRGEQAGGDYINCPFERDEYEAFLEALLGAERIRLHSFEAMIDEGVKAGWHRYFEGCLPVEVMAARGPRTLAFGPLRPVGLRNPHTGRRPYAVLQLRQDNIAGSLYNLVGFQTNLTFREQDRVFRLIPGLEHAEFVRYGQMHRNTFLAAPSLLAPTLQFRTRPDLLCAGQLTGVEGYAGNIATGLLAGINAARLPAGRPPLTLPPTTMLGALCHYVSSARLEDFQPMKANMGLLPLPAGLPEKAGKRERAAARAEQALRDLAASLREAGEEPVSRHPAASPAG